MIKIQDIIFNITDTETTGKEEGVDEAIEIASVRWKLGEGFLERPKSWFVKPNRKIHPSAMAVHHLTEDDIKDAPKLEEIQKNDKEKIQKCNELNITLIHIDTRSQNKFTEKSSTIFLEKLVQSLGLEPSFSGSQPVVLPHKLRLQ